MGINCVLIGHAEPAIDDAAIEALRNGQNFSRPTPLELDAAEELVSLFPGMDMAKFAKNGSDANTAALRLARAITGRKKVAFDTSAPFLAIHDWFIGNTVMDAGSSKPDSDLALPFRFDDLPSLESVFEDNRGQLAAVILEPCRDRRPAPAFLSRLRTLCDTHGTLLVFDEVVTGFRYALSGAQALLGVTPDLMSVGKGMANGYALTALLGKRQYMERGGLEHRQERVFLLSTTNGAEQSALAAGLETIRFYRQHPVIEHLWDTGRWLMDAVAQAARSQGIEEYLGAEGDFACRPMLRTLDAHGTPSLELRTLLHQELLRHGVFMPWVCPSYRHGPSELDQTAEALHAAAAVYAQAIEQKSTAGLLLGPSVKPVFRKFN
jgi:glutamate-1-semialdehyde 2,1-aminomutase